MPEFEPAGDVTTCANELLGYEVTVVFTAR